MTVDDAFDFFAKNASLQRRLGVIREVGLGYIRLGQSATELSGGEAQSGIQLAAEIVEAMDCAEQVRSQCFQSNFRRPSGLSALRCELA
jgi:excinuclease UvrABC ATPase subunit